MMNVDELFDPVPVQWGLRGDPNLWQAMRARLANVVCPESASELERLLKQTYEAITGHSFKQTQPFVIESFKHGGMSSGMVSPEFWRDTAIPLLCGRWRESM